MLPRPVRLRRSSEFLVAVRRGRRSVHGTLVAHVWQPAKGCGSESMSAGAPHGTPARVGFVVDRTVGTAVTRNRVKRRLRDLMGAHVDQLAEGSLCVIRALPAAGSADYHELGHDLDTALLNTMGDGS